MVLNVISKEPIYTNVTSEHCNYFNVINKFKIDKLCISTCLNQCPTAVFHFNGRNNYVLYRRVVNTVPEDISNKVFSSQSCRQKELH